MSERKDKSKIDEDLDYLLRVGVFFGGLAFSAYVANSIWNSIPTKKDVGNFLFKAQEVISLPNVYIPYIYKYPNLSAGLNVVAWISFMLVAIKYDQAQNQGPFSAQAFFGSLGVAATTMAVGNILRDYQFDGIWSSGFTISYLSQRFLVALVDPNNQFMSNARGLKFISAAIGIDIVLNVLNRMWDAIAGSKQSGQLQIDSSKRSEIDASIIDIVSKLFDIMANVALKSSSYEGFLFNMNRLVWATFSADSFEYFNDGNQYYDVNFGAVARTSVINGDVVFSVGFPNYGCWLTYGDSGDDSYNQNSFTSLGELCSDPLPANLLPPPQSGLAGARTQAQTSGPTNIIRF